MARLPIIIVLGASLLAAGCCCPAISGRYYEVGLPAPPSSSCNGARAGEPPAGHGHGLHPLHRWRGSGQDGPVPSQQHADYLSPLAKFHPAPTRPVFEPQLYSSPSLALDPVAKPPRAPAGKP